MVRDMIYGGIEHHTWSYLRGEGKFSPEQAADEIIAVVYRGISATEGVQRLLTARQVDRLEKVAHRLERLAAKK